MIQVDFSLILQIINFLFLILILNFLLYKPMLAIVDKRNRRLAEGREEIERLNGAVAEKMAAYEEKLRMTRVEALTKNKELIKEGAAQAKVAIEAAGKEIAAMTEEAQARMQAEVQAAREILRNQSRLLSLEIAEKMLGRSLQ